MHFDEAKPIFMQIAETLEDAILTGAFEEDQQVPSTTEVSVRYQINPATALKGMNLLVDENILYKKRGVGLFVAPGAVAHLKQKRRDQFAAQYIAPLLKEARRLGITHADIQTILQRSYDDERD